MVEEPVTAETTATTELLAPTPGTGSQRQVPEGFKVHQEGKASVLLQGNDVFYNPAQVVNRDLSVAVLRQFVKSRREDIASGKLKSKGMKANAPKCLDAQALAEKRAADPNNIAILEGLAASGLRAIRYALEVEGVAKVDANDMDKGAVLGIQRNVAYNGPEATARINTTQSDARVIMIQRAGIYDAVDLDPYGSPVQLLDSAVQAVSEGGLLMVTATDMAVLCGNNGEACWAKYGSYPIHRAFCHEMALRILLASIQSHAARHKRFIVPVLSLSIDFYIRIFVRLYTSPKDVKDAASKLAYVFQSSGCDSFYPQKVGRKDPKGIKYSPGRGPAVPQRCPETDSGFLMGGPFWAEQLHDRDFVGAVVQEIQGNKAGYPAHAKLLSLLATALEELPDALLYYSVHELSKTLRTQPPAQDLFRSALVNAGYRVSSTHANPLGVKTDAPPEVVWDVMRAWAKQHPPKKAPEPGSGLEKLLNKEPSIKVDFSRAQGAISSARFNKVARFLPNPEANWGPRRKHGRAPLDEEASPPSKKAKAQGDSSEAPQAKNANAGESNGIAVDDQLAGEAGDAAATGNECQPDAAANEAGNVEQAQIAIRAYGHGGIS